METEVAGPLGIEDLGLDKQDDYEPLCGEALLLECMPQLSNFSTNNDLHHDAINFDGDTAALTDILQDESIFPSCSPAEQSSTLASLLKAGPQRNGDAVLKNEHRGEYCEIRADCDPRGDVTNNCTLAQLLTSDNSGNHRARQTTNVGKRPVAKPCSLSTGKSAMALLASLEREDMDQIVLSDKTLGIKEDLSVSNSTDMSSMVDIVSFPLFNLDDNDGLFEDGIAASDVGSLLKQFEDAAASLTEEMCPEDEDMLQSSSNSSSSSVHSVTPEVDLGGDLSCSESASDTGSSRIEFSLFNEPTTPVKTEPQQESEVMKLLKAGRPPSLVQSSPVQSSPVQSSPRKTQSANNLYAPSPEVIKKIKSSTKRGKGAIMLETPPISRSKSDGTLCRRVAKEKEATECELEQCVEMEIAEENNNTKEDLEMLCGDREAAKVKLVKRISIEAYKARRRNRNGSNLSTPSSSLPSTPNNSRPSSPLPMTLPPIVLPPLDQFRVNRGYFAAIVDHDYCQNVPKPPAQEKNSNGEVEKVKPVRHNSSGDGGQSPDNIAMKTLLLDRNLNEEMKQQAEKDRAESMRNMNKRPRLDTDREVVDMELDSEMENWNDDINVAVMEMEAPMSVNRGRGKLTDKKRPALKDKPAQYKQSFASRARMEQRRYRRRGQSPTSASSPEKENATYIDKIPTYFTTLSTPPTNPGKLTSKACTSQKLLKTGFHDLDRDPSPDRNEPVFNKLPAYFSCFTNSTKYDSTPSSDPLSIDSSSTQSQSQRYPWDEMRAEMDSTQSSRSHTPNLVITSRSLSRSRSTSPSRSKSQPHSRVVSRSRSRSPSLSPSSNNRSRSQQRSTSRKQGRRGSYSSCSSCSSNSDLSSSSSSSSKSRSRSRSWKRSHRPSRSTRSQARSHNRSSHSRSSSRSISRSPSGSRSRSRYRSGRRLARIPKRGRSISWERWEEAQQKKREIEKRKRRQIEQRRIVYVGGIPSSYTRNDLKCRFICFGDIEDVSVHFRDHGDNYGFVTFSYTCDAFAAIEKGKQIKGCEKFDLCFGGRRQFCSTDYADLDGNQEEEEEMTGVLPHSAARGAVGGSSLADNGGGNLDFDQLLKQATKKLKSKR